MSLTVYLKVKEFCVGAKAFNSNIFIAFGNSGTKHTVKTNETKVKTASGSEVAIAMLLASLVFWFRGCHCHMFGLDLNLNLDYSLESIHPASTHSQVIGLLCPIDWILGFCKTEVKANISKQLSIYVFGGGKNEVRNSCQVMETSRSIF